MGKRDSFQPSRREVLTASAATLTVPTPVVGATASSTIAAYVLARLKQHGASVLFGVPGATCDPLFAAAEVTGTEVVVTASDLEAGYAADGYARMKGLSALSVTYGVGTMSLMPAIAGAFAERSPVVIINGGPSTDDLKIQKQSGSFFSHSLGKEAVDFAIFKEVTAHAVRIDSGANAPAQIDNAIRIALTQSRPVYIEIAKHAWNAKCAAPGSPIELTPPGAVDDALAADVITRLQNATKPVLLLGIELQRFGLEDAALRLVTKLRIPYATTLLAKSVIPETTPGFIGVYGGDHAAASVKKTMEEADVVFALGCVLGRQYRSLATRKGSLLVANDGSLRIDGKPSPAALASLLTALEKQAKPLGGSLPKLGLSFRERRGAVPEAKPSSERGMTYDEVMESVSNALDERFITITDTSLSMYPAADLNIAGHKGFMCNAVWQAIGFSVAASVGVAIAQDKRPLVICGDGGFQMTAQSLSTMARRKLRSIIIVLDNGLYGIEQWLLDAKMFRDGGSPKPYLPLQRWDYAMLAKALGFTHASSVESLQGFQQAFTSAREADGPVMIHALIKPHDLPAILRGEA